MSIQTFWPPNLKNNESNQLFERQEGKWDLCNKLQHLLKMDKCSFVNQLYTTSSNQAEDHEFRVQIPILDLKD